MKQEDIKEGMEVIIRGVVEIPDDGTERNNVFVRIENLDEDEIYFNPEDIEPAETAPKRKFRKGDIVRCIAPKLGDLEPGREYTLTSDEESIVGYDKSGKCASARCFELVRSVEEIEECEPFFVDEFESSFIVKSRKVGDIRAIFLFGDDPSSCFSREHALRMANNVCVRLILEATKKR